jgi:colanic acid/amylovoran biosynthesis glycosyltransferase
MATTSLKWLIGYYFKRYILNRPAQQVLGDRYEEYARWKEAQNRSKRLPNIAVAKPNRDKYTETFIRQRIESLEKSGYYIHNLFGGYLPTADYHRGLLLFNSKPAKRFLDGLVVMFNCPADYFNRKILKWYLQKNKVKLVVIEFGTTAAEVYAVCVAANIPFIVTFHGYDVWNEKVVAGNTQRYKTMFAHAAEVIGVSRGICEKLMELGCPAQKLHYLPAPAAFEKITYTDHSKKPPVFLSVGRFAEMKSPHLTILAFNEVLKKIPEATLVMIGKDGGGDLFEACRILARALQIDSRIAFKGILSHDEVLLEMQSARIMVQHSLTAPITGDKEGTPVAIMEAMACGLPIVSTRHSGIAELITHGYNGLLVEEYDYIGMANCMIELALNNEQAAALGLAAYESIKHNRLMQQNETIFLGLVKKHIRP